MTGTPHITTTEPPSTGSLSTFIRRNGEQILEAWDSFARELPTGRAMTDVALRDHAQAMLDVIATDLELPQTTRQQKDKSAGLLDAVDQRHPETAAAAHGSGRADRGFSPMQMVAEFRALRASVTQLWLKESHRAGADALQEMIRFNEAIDQAIAESLARFTHEMEQTQGRFLAILGHDLRTPLGAIITSTQFLLDAVDLQEPALGLVQGVARSSRRMNQLVADLLELSLTRFGDAIPITRAPMDAGAMVKEAVAEVAAYYGPVGLEVAMRGDLHGDWDRARLAQAVVNLLNNAVQHGAKERPIVVTATGEATEVAISVKNEGPPIPPDQLDGIFAATKLGVDRGRDRRHLGLGLYIVDKIAAAHEGRIDVQSSAESGTEFTLHLPRAMSGSSAPAIGKGRHT